MTSSAATPPGGATLPSGATMPLLGFGTWQLRDQSAQSCTEAALQAGYRHLDTATMYANEAEVGSALKAAGGEGIFVTSKLPPDRAGNARRTLEESLDKLGVDALDLWLIHWPPADSVATWQEFIAARDAGLVRDIGVSNYSPGQLDELFDKTGEMPAVNQIRWSPLIFDAATARAHEERHVVLEGYSGLKGGTLTDATITGIAHELNRTPAQVIIRWHLQHGFVVIPKSATPSRIVENADVAGFELTPAQLASLDGLAR